MQRSFKINYENEHVDLTIIKSDITTLKVDAIVNAANERLLGGGGVDGAIHRKAGPRLLEECFKFPEVRPGCRCPTGEARITNGYNLPCDYIIHTVSPIFSILKNIKDIEEDLINCYKNSIKIANDYGLKSIAFPSIGTGAYSIPIKIASETAINTVIKECIDTSIEKVYFVLFEDNDYFEYENTLEKIATKQDILFFQ